MRTWAANGNEVRAYGRRPRFRFEIDDARWGDCGEAYTAAGWAGVAWRVLGWEVEPTADTEWDGIEERTGKVLAVMVGDDMPHAFEPEELTALGELDYCLECGQVGCTHDGRDRSPAEGDDWEARRLAGEVTP